MLDGAMYIRQYINMVNYCQMDSLKTGKTINYGELDEEKYPPSSSSFSGGSYYKRCFIVDVDGKKLPNKLDLYAFRRGKKITSNGESDKEEESEDEGQEGAKKE